MVFYGLFFAALMFVIFLFSSPKLSPIPYFPSNKKDMSLIIKSFGLANRQTIIDLGAGDGIVVFDAAYDAHKRGLDTNFVAVEINPVLIAVLQLRRLVHPNRRRIKIVMDDIFKMDFGRLIDDRNSKIFYLYISPWHMEKTLDNIKRQFGRFSVVSYMYPVKSMAKERETRGVHPVFVYNR